MIQIQEDGATRRRPKKKTKRVMPLRAGLHCLQVGLCNQCAQSLYGIPLGDFCNAVAFEDVLGDALANCQGCGYTLIDRDGNCRLAHKHEESMKQGHSEYKEQYQQTLERFFGSYTAEAEQKHEFSGTDISDTNTPDVGVEADDVGVDAE